MVPTVAGGLPDLHDAVLEAVSVDFGSGRAELLLTVPGDPAQSVRLGCEGFRRFLMDRDQPWGPSAVIMGIAGGQERLDIEMQSGDHILIYGPDLQVTVSDPVRQL